MMYIQLEYFLRRPLYENHRRKSIPEDGSYKGVNKDIRDFTRGGGTSAADGGETGQHPDLQRAHLIREISQTSRERADTVRSQFR